MWFKTILRPKQRELPALFDEAFLRRLERLMLQARRSLRGNPSSGEHLSRRQRPATIFSDHRPYSPGDDVRTIDWNIYAHHDQLFVRLGEVEQRISVHLLLDISRSMASDPSKLRVAQQLVGALGYLALAHHDEARVVPFDRQLLPGFGPALGKGSLIGMLRFIEGLEPSQPTALGQVLSRYARAQQGGLLVLCSDLLSPEGLEQGLRAFSDRWQILVLHLLSRQELLPDLSGPIELEDSETGERLLLNLDAEVIDGYRRNLAAWQQSIVELCGRRGASYAQIPTDWPLERAVIPYLRVRGMLG